MHFSPPQRCQACNSFSSVSLRLYRHFIWHCFSPKSFDLSTIAAMSRRRAPTDIIPRVEAIGGALAMQTKTDKIRLLYFHDIPQWQQDNEYIISGYRTTSGSIWKSIASLLYINNQTINTYSHLLGCVMFIFLPWYFYENVYKYQQHGKAVDVLLISIYTTGVAICFAFSAT